MIIKLAIIALSILGLIFVVMPYFNYAVFDFQCEKAGCSGQICNARNVLPSSSITTCEFKPEYGCLKDCQVRKNKCSFDLEFRDACMECVTKCQSEIEQPQKDSCYQSCYKK